MDKKYGVHIIKVTNKTKEEIIKNPVTLEKINSKISVHYLKNKNTHIVLLEDSGEYIGEILPATRYSKGLPVVKYLAKYNK